MKTILVDAADTLTHEVNGDFVVDASLLSLLEEYDNPKIVVTNADADQQLTYGLVNLPYELFSLSHSPNKDDPEYFKKLMAQYQLAPADLVYFEHSQDAVYSAQSLSITTYFFDHNARDMAALKIFLDSNL